METTIDSGAARYVRPADFCKQFPVKPSAASAKNECFRTATGMRVKNEGERVVHGVTPEGPRVNMKYAVADIAVPLESVSQICDSGATVTFTAKGGQIDGPAGRICFERRGDTYLRTTWVRQTVPPTKPRAEKAPWLIPLSSEDVGTASAASRVSSRPGNSPSRVFSRPGNSP